MYDALDAAVEAMRLTAWSNESQYAEDHYATVRETQKHLQRMGAAVEMAETRSEKMRAIVDLRMAGEEYETATKAWRDAVAYIHKTGAGRLAVLEAEMVPFAAEQSIAGTTHVAEYQGGSDRVVVTDYAAARVSAPPEFWRFKDPEPDKVKLAKAMKAGRKFEGIGWDEGPPSLRIVKLDGKKEDGDE
jgi:hypothetical protein